MKNHPLKVDPGFSKANRDKIKLYTTLSLICLGVLWFIANYASTAINLRKHIANDSNHSISPLTQQILNLLDSPLDIILYFNPDLDTFESLDMLTREYALENSNVRVRHIDYQSDPAAAKIIKNEFKMAFGGEKDVVLLKYKDGYRAILDNELSVLDVNPLLQGTSKEIKRSAFKGEQAITSAILSLTLKDEKNVAFLVGHQEYSISDTSDNFGYSRFAQSLEKNLCKTESISLTGTNTIPNSTDLLVLANPSSNYSRSELIKIATYIESGGQILALIGSRTKSGLEALFSNYGIGIEDNVLVDVANSSNPSGTDMSITNFSAHPITRPIYGGQLYMIMPRSVHSLEKVIPPDENLTIEEIIYSNSSAQEIRSFKDNRLMPSPDDRVGEFPVAVLSTKKVSTPEGQKIAKILVIGESLFLGNTGIQSLMNYEFGLQCANFLMERDLFINNIPPKPVKEFELILTKDQKIKARWLLLLVIPGLFFIAGLAIHLKRAPKA